MKICPACGRRFVDTQSACPLDDTPLEPGTGAVPEHLGRVLGSYRLIGLLGEGGMGSVYVAAHARLNRFVAIKLLRPGLQHRKDHLARFFGEARAIEKLHHPHIVESIDLVDDVVDGAYCVLELLRGPDLKSRLAGGPLPVATAIDIAAQIADALAAVHAQGLVHRDLKPPNVILVRRGERSDFVKLIDFGVAQIGNDAANGGTPAYMAPEQATGERVDGRADLYALGVILFEMVTGRHPFPSKTDHEYLMRNAHDVPPVPSRVARVANIPRQLDRLIGTCLAKRAADRFATATALGAALRVIDVAAPRRRPRWRWAAAGAVVAAVAGAAILVPGHLGGQSRPAVVAPAAAPPPSPPPSPPPPPPPVAVRPAMVTVSFTSTPPGARVFRVGETVPLGITPFQTSFARSDRASHVRFELAAHEPAEAVVALTASTAIAITLVPSAAPARHVDHHREPAKPKVQRDGMMDPFAHSH
ncbi:MAG: serine/threonine-protein kinase [Acidobacteriota bacterium]